ncbi:uncharacterized protein LOC5520271 isoform X3 [Nematostella vectensis]|nr:uncharacterized protein LOC5520271 isoform X3 [Nematostella vectensis]XP_048575606.1 uncharacterized protein LOC5520271 isoform X3 [Nematostella vectensis]XP_048575607.1 uncharacterized protein LOC5520271 isoform X3 [Nematostella vectensis]XP_048575608.1 uncharacterized protein LOC5520271 isoform X3 [Nematostella vectensis]
MSEMSMREALVLLVLAWVTFRGSYAQTDPPTVAPTANVTNSTEAPTLAPTSNITNSTEAPTLAPTSNIANSTEAPTLAPTEGPTLGPTVAPTSNVTNSTEAPTSAVPTTASPGITAKAFLVIRYKGTFRIELLFQMSDMFQKEQENVTNEIKAALPGVVQNVVVLGFRPGSIDALASFDVLLGKTTMKDVANDLDTYRQGSPSLGIIDMHLVQPDSLCQVPLVNITNIPSIRSPVMTINRSSTFTIQTYTTLNCSQSSTIFEWKVWRVLDGLKLSENAELVVVGTAQWTINPRVLEYGNYLVQFRVIMESNQKIYGTDIKLLTVIPSSLVAQIKGGSLVTRGFNQLITLDASPSIDPDVGPGNYTGMTFYWLCKVKGESFPIADAPAVAVIDPNGVKGAGGCFDTGIGRLASTDLSVAMDTGKMTVGTSYVVKLVVVKSAGSDPTRESAYQQTLQIVQGEPPSVDIRCIINCGARTSLSSRLKLSTNCTSPEQTCAKPLTYSWSLQSWDVGSSSWTTVPDLQSKIFTSLSSPDIYVKKNVLSSGTKYRLTVTISAPGLVPGVSSYDLETNSPPTGGTCEVTPTQGFVLETVFTLKCQGWTDLDNPLVYQFFYVTEPGLTSVITYGRTNEIRTKLPVGVANRNFVIVIRFLILDSLSAATEVQKTVKVRTPLASDASETKNTINKASNAFSGLLQSGDVQGATEVANAILGTMDNAPQESLNNTERTQIVDNLVEQMTSQVQVQTLQALSQVTSVIGRATANPQEVSMKAQNDSLKALVSLTGLLQSKSKNTDVLDDGLVEAGAENLVLSLGNLLNSASQKAQLLSGESAELSQNQQQSIDASKQSVFLVDSVGNTLLSRKVVGEPASVVRTASLSLVLGRQTPSDLLKTKITGLKSSSVELPDDSRLRELVQGRKYVDSQMTLSEYNPFTWDTTSRLIDSHVTSFDLRDERGNEIVVSGLSEPIELVIPKENSTRNVSTAPLSSFLKPDQIAYHKVNIESEGAALLLEISPARDISIRLLIGYKSRPTLSQSVFQELAADLPSCSASGAQRVCKRELGEIFISSAVLNRRGSYFIGLQYVKTSRTRRSCFGNGRQKRSCIEPKDPPQLGNRTVMPAYDHVTDVNYTLSTQQLACMFWSNKKWSTTGCTVGPNSSTQALQCLCIHLTPFGGGLFVAPNPIDFDVVLLELTRLDESGNVAVLVTIIVLLLLYLVTAVFARRADRKDQRKYGPLIFIDRSTAGHMYQLTVVTGVWRGSGTTAHVAIEIHGSEAVSQPIILHRDMQSPRVTLATGNADQFMISLPASLGSVQQLNVGHDNAGSDPSWFLNQIVITSLEDNKSWHFVHKDWLALEKADGKIQKTLFPTLQAEMETFKYSFNHRTSKKFTEDHLWLSVVTKPPYSNFTRLQRATCCLCILFSAMVVDAMFYKLNPTADPTINVGPLKFSWRQLMVGIQSSFIVVPVGLGIVALFQNSRQTRSTVKSDDSVRPGYLCCCGTKGNGSDFIDPNEDKNRGVGCLCCFGSRGGYDVAKHQTDQIGDVAEQQTDQIGDVAKHQTVQIGDVVKHQTDQIGDVAKHQADQTGDVELRSMPKSSALHHIVNVKNTCAYADCTLLNMQKADSENTSTHFVGRAHSSPALHLLPDSKSVGAPAHVIRVRSSSSSGGCPLGNDAFSRAECGTVTVVNKTNELKNLTEHPLSISSENVHFEGLENSVLSNIKRNDSFVDLGSQEALLAKVNETESDLVKLIRTSRGHSIESSGTALTNVDRLPDFAKTDQVGHEQLIIGNNQEFASYEPSGVTSVKKTSNDHSEIPAKGLIKNNVSNGYQDVTNLEKIQSSSILESDVDKENKSCCEKVMSLFSKEGVSEDQFSLPHFCVYLAWFLCFVVVSVSAAFTFMYSLVWQKTIAEQWLTSMLVSFTQDLFVIQPLKICILAIFLSCFFRKRATKDLVSGPKELIHVQETIPGQSRESANQLSFSVPNEEHLKKVKKYKVKESKMFAFAREVSLYLLFLTLLTIVCYGNRSSHGFQMKTNVVNDYSDFYKIDTDAKYWSWMKSQFVSGLYAGSWYNGKKERQEEYIGNKASILIGMPRLRQLRVQSDSCKLAKKVRVLADHCYDEYSLAEEDKTRYYLPQWLPVPGDVPYANLTRLCPRPWRYSTAVELGFSPSWGYFHTYNGGGYVADLGYDNGTAFQVSTTLQSNRWMSSQTRAVLLEFTIFNVNTNYLTVSTFYYESRPTAFGKPYQRIESLALYGTESGAYEFYLVCVLLFMLLTVYYVVQEMRQVYKGGKGYFKEPWNWVELLQSISAASVVVCNIIKEKTLLEAITELRKNPFVTVSFQKAVMIQEAENIALSFTVFFATMKLLRLIRFNPHIIIFSFSLDKSKELLLSYSAILITVFLGYGFLFHLVFGSSLFQCSTMLNTMYFELLLSIGEKMKLDNLRQESEILGPLIGFPFKLLLIFIFMNFFVAILNDAYEDVNTNTDRKGEQFEMSDFIIQRLKEMLLRKKYDLLQNEDETKSNNEFSKGTELESHHSRENSGFTSSTTDLAGKDKETLLEGDMVENGVRSSEKKDSLASKKQLILDSLQLLGKQRPSEGEVDRNTAQLKHFRSINITHLHNDSEKDSLLTSSKKQLIKDSLNVLNRRSIGGKKVLDTVEETNLGRPDDTATASSENAYRMRRACRFKPSTSTASIPSVSQSFGNEGRHRVVELVNNYLRQKQMKALSEQPEIRKSRKKIKRRNLQRKLFQSEHHMKQQGYQYEKLLDVMDNQGGDLTSMMSELEEDYIEEKTDFLHLFQLLVPKPELEEQKDMKTMIMSLRFISKLKKARAARLSREPKPPEEKPQQAPTVDVARSSRLLSMLKKRTLEKRASQTEVEPVDASDKALVQTLLNNPDLAFLTDEEILSSIIALRNARKKGVPEHLRMRNFMRSVQMQ